jgi:hypothetical protein
MIVVEAKSRHRPGVLHEPGDPPDLSSLKADIDGPHGGALAKPTHGLPYLIGIDANVPLTPERTENFRGRMDNYTVRVPRSEAELITAVKKLIDEGKRLYEAETQELPNIHFDRHLYQPLLVERGDRVKSDPPGL